MKKPKIDNNENEEVPEIGQEKSSLPESGEQVVDGGYLRTQKGNLTVRGVDMSEEVDSSWVSLKLLKLE